MIESLHYAAQNLSYPVPHRAKSMEDTVCFHRQIIAK